MQVRPTELERAQWSGMKMGSEGVMVHGCAVPGLDKHCVGWRLEDFELNQDREIIGMESRTGGDGQEDVISFLVNIPVKDVTKSVSGSGDRV